MKYFAYGSNMLTRRLQERVPSAQFSNRALLSGHVLVFDKLAPKSNSGKCGIVRSEREIEGVCGVIFDIDEAELPLLDKAEGLGNGYTRSTVRTYAYDQDEYIEAATYFPTSRQPGIKPFCWYKALVVAGLEEHKFTEEYIARIRDIETMQDPNQERATRHWKMIYDANQELTDREIRSPAEHFVL